MAAFFFFFSSQRDGGSAVCAGPAAADGAGALGKIPAEQGREWRHTSMQLIPSVDSVFRDPVETTGTLGGHMGSAVEAAAVASP